MCVGMSTRGVQGNKDMWVRGRGVSTGLVGCVWGGGVRVRVRWTMRKTGKQMHTTPHLSRCFQWSPGTCCTPSRSQTTTHTCRRRLGRGPRKPHHPHPVNDPATASVPRQGQQKRAPTWGGGALMVPTHRREHCSRWARPGRSGKWGHAGRGSWCRCRTGTWSCTCSTPIACPAQVRQADSW